VARSAPEFFAEGRLTLLLALLLAAEPRAVLTGQVRSRGTRASVPVATLSSDDGTTAETDADGRFRLELPAGVRHVRVSASGFVPKDFEEELAEGTAVDVVYALQPRVVAPYETVVRDTRERTELSRVSLHGAELREVAGTGGDPLKVMMLMPGVTSPISGLGYPVVRGSAPASTGYYLDGVRIPQLFHVFLGPSVVHADLIDGIDFFPGGAPVEYGRLLGGAIDAHLAKPRPGFHAEAQADFINAGGLVEGLIEKTQTSLTLSGRVSYTRPEFALAAQLLSAQRKLVADFWDYQARIEQPVLGGSLRLLSMGSSDTFGDMEPDPSKRSEGTQRVTFHRVDLRYRHPVFGGQAEVGASGGVDDLGIASDGPLEMFDPGHTGISAQSTVIRQVLGTGRLKWSGELSRYFSASLGGTVDRMFATEHQDFSNMPTLGPTTTSSNDVPIAIGTFWGAWAELTFRPVHQLSITGGVRLDDYHLDPAVTQTSADPRLSLAWKENDRLTLRAAAGLYHQPPTFIISLPVIDLASVSAGLQEVLQTSAGLTWKVWNDLELSVDTYFNPMGRVVEVGFVDNTGDSVIPNPTKANHASGATTSVTTGLAYGADFMLRWPLKRHVFGWLTLSVQRSTRLQTFVTDPSFFGASTTRTAELPYAFDQTLVANAVLSYRFDSGITCGAVLHFNTGRPESGDFGSRTKDPATLAVGDMTFQYWRTRPLDAVDRLPPYFRLDVRVSKTWLTDWFSLEAYLDVLNVTVQQETIGYDYRGGLTVSSMGAVNTPLQKLPNTVPIIIPSLGLKGRY
jgi:hypothetical protein